MSESVRERTEIDGHLEGLERRFPPRSLVEGAETVHLTLGTPTTSLGSLTTAVLTIEDDDSAPHQGRNDQLRRGSRTFPDSWRASVRRPPNADSSSA